MAEKANPFRDALYDALGRRGVRWVRDFGGGRHAELYTREDRWLALLVQKTLSAQPWWNIPHYFEELHALEQEHPAYLVVEVFQDDPQGGTVLTGKELEPLFMAGSADRFRNVKVLPSDLSAGTYLRGAERMADFIQALLTELPPEPGLTPTQLIPASPRRRRRSRWMRELFGEEDSQSLDLRDKD
ncbi:MAG: hypothetical protein E6J55_17145 [Deltaproteobacteria bacterium]|nr:MAG: hypothetical protein E6J55_17145 [Deltaproteobacteria bacterium]